MRPFASGSKENSMTHDRTPQNRRKAILFLTVLMGLTLMVALIICRPFLPMLAYSVILATVFYPMQRRLVRRVHGRGFAALISTGALCLLIVVPLMIILHLAAGQALEIAKGIEARSASEGGPVPFVTHYIDRTALFLNKYVDTSKFDIPGQLQSKAKVIGAQILPTAGTLAGSLVGTVLNLFLGLITVYVLLRDGDRIVRYVLYLLPLTEHQAKRLLQILKDNAVANVQGIFAVAAAQGLGTGLALAILGVSPATLLGIAAAFCSVIPIFGTGLVWGPAAIYLLASGHAIKGLILLGLGAGVISQLDSLVRPIFVGKKMQANALVMMIAMLGGVKTYGFLGLFIGPVVVALIVALSQMLREEVADGAVSGTQATTGSHALGTT
jgi:predicted PurR-regulated permease PerM